MESVRNFRTLDNLPVAGGTIRSGLLYRSGHLAGLSDDDAQRISDLGIRTIIDLRTESDIASEGEDRVPDGARHHRVPIYDEAGRGDDLRARILGGSLDSVRAEMGDGRAHQMAIDGAVAFVLDAARRATFATATAIVIDPDNWPVLWHCSAGKDRAGWLGTTVLLAAQASPETIIDHYLESNRMVGHAAMIPEGEMKELIRPFIEVHEDYVNAQLAAVSQRWGDAAGLFDDGFGISAEALQRFRAALVAVDNEA